MKTPLILFALNLKAHESDIIEHEERQLLMSKLDN